MIPAEFDYVAPETLEEAIGALAERGEDAKVLAGGHSLPPMMKLRLATPALIIPGQDAAHATSAARYLEECLSRAEYWDEPVAAQTKETAPARVIEFLERAAAAS